jgi:uncharacterized protein
MRLPRSATLPKFATAASAAFALTAAYHKNHAPLPFKGADHFAQRSGTVAALRMSVASASTTTSSDGNCGSVRSIHRYPVKSCGGETLDEVLLSRLSALPGDRQYLWVDAAGKFITQRPYEARQGNDGNGVPRLATIDASISPDGSTLRLNAPDATPLEPLLVPTSDSSAGPSRRRDVTLFSGSAKVVDQIEAAGDWFRRWCGIEGACLVKADETATSLADDWRASRVAFQEAAFPGEEASPRTIPLDDGGTILVVSRASLDELNRRLAEKNLPPVNMSRFRPNFVLDLDGLPPHAEDGWREFKLGDVSLRVERPCTRCSTVLVDQEAGTSDDVNWLSKVLARYRLSRPDPAFGSFDLQGTKFGVYCTPLSSGTVKVGDSVQVVQRK